MPTTVGIGIVFVIKAVISVLPYSITKTNSSNSKLMRKELYCFKSMFQGGDISIIFYFEPPLVAGASSRARVEINVSSRSSDFTTFCNQQNLFAANSQLQKKSQKNILFNR